MMATISKLVQLASFFAGKDQVKETLKNKVTCVAAQRHGDFYAIGVDRHIKVNLISIILLHETYICSSHADIQLQGYHTPKSIICELSSN